VVVVCEHSDRCGGCPLIHLPYAEQLEHKRARVAAPLARYSALSTVRVEQALAAKEIVEYRVRAKLVAGPSATLGLYTKGGGHEVVDIARCRVLSPAIAAAATHVRSLMGAFPESGAGSLRAVDLRETVDEGAARVLVTFVVNGARAGAVLPSVAEELLRRCPAVAGVAANFHTGQSPQILGSRTEPLAGATSAKDRVGMALHLATFGSFVQAHRGQAANVHARVARAVFDDAEEPLARARPDARGADSPSEGPRVLDLYAGSGALALGLASAGAAVTMVESFAPALHQAREAARQQGLEIRTECGDVADVLKTLCRERRQFDAVVVNPPRRGTSPRVREQVARLEPRVIIYVACEPETLARDLDHLARLGYAASVVEPVDMMPLTEQVETVAVLCASPPLPPQVLYEDDEVLIVDKAAHEPTTPQGEYRSSLLSRIRRLAGAEMAVPVHRLDVGTGGVVVFARRPGSVAAWAAMLASPATRKVYVAGVRGIPPRKGIVARPLRENGAVYRARTRFRRVAVLAHHSVLQVSPEQGRTHQIRRHLAAMGHPVLGDERYGDAATNRYFAEKHGLDRAFLHCALLEFDHPRTHERHAVRAPLGGDLRSVLDALGASEAALAMP
jgi:23S rRNA (uracil1939-C5)-methyltransferase